MAKRIGALVGRGRVAGATTLDNVFGEVVETAALEQQWELAAAAE